jgi:sugar lactone lactonase YvrE
MFNRNLSVNRLYWMRGVITAAFLLAAVWLLSGCESRLTAGHGTPPGFEPKWDKLVVEVAAFDDQQPTGIAVSHDGRVFVTFPWWNDRPSPSVAEVLPDGTLKPYPSAYWNGWDGKSGPSALRGFVCAQAMYVDADNYLWVLDAGNPGTRDRVVTAGPKLFKINLEDDSIAQVFYFDHKRDFTRSSYLSDFRVDNKTQTAYIADSARGTIYVVDLKTRQTHHVLLGDPSTTADAGVIARVGSKEWRSFAGLIPQVNVSGLELSHDGRWLYYHAMTGRRIYRVPTDTLRDTTTSDAQRSASIQDLGPTGSVIDGMWLDADDNLYMAAIERDAIIVRRPNGAIETFVADPRLKWPDSLAFGPDGYLYFTTSMRHLRKPYRIADQVEDPYFVMKASPEKVARANVTRQIADEKQQQAAWYAGKAGEAERLAKIAAEQAERELREAAARLEVAEAAQDDAAQFAEAHEQSVVKIEQAAERQEQAAHHATELSTMASKQAKAAERAAEKARQAAEIARRLAGVAAEKAEQTRVAQAQADKGAEQAELARRQHESALAEAERAAEAAARAEATAKSLIDEAQLAAELARQAEQNAERERLAASNLRELASQARAQAVIAERVATDAEFAEINGQTDKPTGTADVPTETD